MKEELAAQFNSVEELSAYLKTGEEEDKRNGIKYVSFYVPPENKPTEEPDDDVN